MFLLLCRRINVGTRFQAEIPSLQDRSLAEADEHKAELVWQPWGDLETNKVTQENGKKVKGCWRGQSCHSGCRGNHISTVSIIRNLLELPFKWHVWVVLKTVWGAKLVYEIACMGQGETGRIGSFNHEQLGPLLLSGQEQPFAQWSFLGFVKTTHTQLLYFWAIF